MKLTPEQIILIRKMQLSLTMIQMHTCDAPYLPCQTPKELARETLQFLDQLLQELQPPAPAE